MKAEIAKWQQSQSGVVERYRDQLAEGDHKRLPKDFQDNAELLAAAVMRLEELLRASHDSSTSLLSQYVSLDPIMAPYFSATNGDSESAVILARADVEYWRALRRAGWKTSLEVKKTRLGKLMKYIVAPLLFALLTGLLGHVIFQRQRFFEARFQRLESGQRRAVAILAGIRSTSDLLAGWEVYGGGLSPRDQLEDYKEEIEQIKALGGGMQGSEQVNKAAQRAFKEVDSYLLCLEEKVGVERTKSSTSNCTEKFSLAAFETLVTSFDDAMSALDGYDW